ncbi:anti-sigma F factor [Andreesenia angusta]|uniref:Anti-sigma F factor n=1 Tax=Andreesenia angusta TaxID=39480 RepID=A0A1S1V7Z8_9FIRM|nr:ATP-binding protein [Andreesenia angusta]OHW61839.1 anti-sigma F factor [Andreesenia angusta]
MLKYEKILKIKSDLDDVKNNLEDIVEQLNKLLKNEDLMFDLRLILNELVVNGVIHGNKLDENKKVELRVLIEDNNIQIKVMDEGHGFEYDRDSYDPLDMKSSGRGLFIVDGLSDELSISDEGVSVVKYLS